MPVKYIPVKLSTLPVDADRSCVDWQCRLCTTKLISSARVHGLYIATASAEDRTVHSNIVTAVGGVMNLMERIGGGAVRDMMDDAKEAGMRMVDDKHGVIAYQYTVCVSHGMEAAAAAASVAGAFAAHAATPRPASLWSLAGGRERRAMRRGRVRRPRRESAFMQWRHHQSADG